MIPLAKVIEEEPFAALAILLLLFALNFLAFYGPRKPIRETLLWATIFTVGAVIALFLSVGGPEFGE